MEQVHPLNSDSRYEARLLNVSFQYNILSYGKVRLQFTDRKTDTSNEVNLISFLINDY